jgi:hypothetical protein
MQQGVGETARSCKEIAVHATNRESDKTNNGGEVRRRTMEVASCFRGALPPVDLRAVCLVRAISTGTAADCGTRSEPKARDWIVGWEVGRVGIYRSLVRARGGSRLTSRRRFRIWWPGVRGSKHTILVPGRHWWGGSSCSAQLVGGKRWGTDRGEEHVHQQADQAIEAATDQIRETAGGHESRPRRGAATVVAPRGASTPAAADRRTRACAAPATWTAKGAVPPALVHPLEQLRRHDGRALPSAASRSWQFSELKEGVRVLQKREYVSAKESSAASWSFSRGAVISARNVMRDLVYDFDVMYSLCFKI